MDFDECSHVETHQQWKGKQEFKSPSFYRGGYLKCEIDFLSEINGIC